MKKKAVMKGKRKVKRSEEKHCRGASEGDKSSKVKKIMKLAKSGKGKKEKKKKSWWNFG